MINSWVSRVGRSFAAMSLVTALLGGCAGLLGPRSVEVPLQRLQASIERKFPFDQRALELIDIRLSNPRLTLQADSNRVSATIDASVQPLFTSRVWRGNFTLSGLLQLDPARRAIMLAQPQIDQIAFDGLEPVLAAQVARGGGLLIAQLLRDMPLYTFGAEDFRYGGAHFLPTNITTNSRGIVVTFEPVK